MKKLEAMLEAERRGILPPDKQEILNEARTRGLIDSPAPEGGVSDSMSWGEAFSGAAGNFGSSAVQFGEDIVQPIIHPIDTAKTLGQLGLGIIQKLIPGEQADEQMADAVGQFFMDRYGSIEGIKNTLANDPVGMLADASAVLTGGGMLAAKAPGMVAKAGRTGFIPPKVGPTGMAVEKTGQAMQSTGKAIDPLVIAGRTAGKGGKYLGAGAAHVLGAATGTGGEPIKRAAAAGAEGGEKAADFQGNLRGAADMEDAVTDLHTALAQMKQQKNAAYREGMAGVAADKTVIDFGPIDAAFEKIANVGTYKGQQIRPNAAGAVDEIRKVFDEWKLLDPAEFHTPEGLDALKQKIGDIGTGYDPMTKSQGRMVADQVYAAIKNEVTKQAPEYAKVMKDYETAATQIREIERSLSGGRKASTDQALRKLQSVMRNNANTNYGNRVKQVDVLAESGAPNIREKLAGQALSSPAPRGIQGVSLAPSALGLGVGVGSGFVSPWALPALAASSPRLVGEAAYYAGKGAGLAKSLLGNVDAPKARAFGNELFQGGRIGDEDFERQMLVNALQGRGVTPALR